MTASDQVGKMMIDSSTIDFTYNSATKTISADAIAAGIAGLGFITVTWAALDAAMTGSTLIPGAKYLVTDPIDGGQVILRAAAVNKLETAGSWIRTNQLRAFGAFYIDGAAGSVDDVNVAGVNQLTAVIPFSVNILTTATNVANNINANGARVVNAVVCGNSGAVTRCYIALERITGGVNTDLITVTTTTLTSGDIRNMQRGAANNDAVYDIEFNFTSGVYNTSRIRRCIDTKRNIDITCEDRFVVADYTGLSEFDSTGTQRPGSWRRGEALYNDIVIKKLQFAKLYTFSVLAQMDQVYIDFFSAGGSSNLGMIIGRLTSAFGGAMSFGAGMIATASTMSNIAVTDTVSFGGILGLVNFSQTTFNKSNLFASACFITSVGTTNFSGSTFNGQVNLTLTLSGASNNFSGSQFRNLLNQTSVNIVNLSNTVVDNSYFRKRFTQALTGAANLGLVGSPIFVGNLILGFRATNTVWEATGLTGVGAFLQLGIETDDDDAMFPALPIATLTDRLIFNAPANTKSTAVDRRIIATPTVATITAGTISGYVEGFIL